MKNPAGKAILENRKKPDVLYAFTEDKIELPILDITNPAFCPAFSEEELTAEVGAFIKKHRNQSAFEAFLMRTIMKILMSHSVLGRALMGAQSGFLGGLETYLLKLGAANLGGGYTNAIDKMIAKSFASVSMRLRLEEMARMMNERAVPQLSRHPMKPLYLLNIAGGPASDSLNALILIRKEFPELLSGRKIVIHVLDVERGGAVFGANALDALKADGAALQGLDAELLFSHYDWGNTDKLATILADLGRSGSVVLVSTEGGLFEYGTDEIVKRNLIALARVLPGDAHVIGSVIRSDGPSAILGKRLFRIPTIERDFAQMNALVADAGWQTVKCRELLFCRIFELGR
jgi:hypothetical protein